MKTNKTLYTLLLVIALCSSATSWKMTGGRWTGQSALYAAGQGTEAFDFVRVTVRFAKIRIQPSSNAKIIKEIGYGTMLRVLGRSGEYFQVVALDAPVATTTGSWYVLRNEVDAVQPEESKALVDDRRVSCAPANPAAGQPVLFTASHFRTPNLLKWDMGDGTVLTSGSKISQGEDMTLSYAYAAAGRYLVRVFDDSGDMNSPPVAIQVTVSAHMRLLQINPEQPAANHPLTITAFNFHTPEKIAWDLGDGTEIHPGAGPGVVKPTFLVSHVYENEGTFTVKAYDSGGDKTQPPLTVEVRVAADPRRIKVVPAGAETGMDLEFSAVNFNTPERLRWEMGDGTVIPGEKEAGVQVGSLVTYSYKKPGNYLVKAYDWNGDVTRKPVQFIVTVRDRVSGTTEAVKPILPAPANETPPGIIPVVERKKPSLIKIGPFAGYFKPKNADFKEMYGEGDVLFGARLGIHVWQGFYFWLSASQYKVIGKTTVTEDKTTLTLLPVGAFVRYHVGNSFFVPYAGIGLSFLSYKEESEYVGNHKGHGSNISFEAGIEMKINRYISLDLGARLDQLKVRPENPLLDEVELGGLQAGITLLVSF